MGPVGFEPTTKGFTCPGVSAGSGLSLHPCARGCACGCGMLQACHQGHSSPQVVSAPSAGVPAARLRIAMGDDPEGFPEFIPSTSRVSARRHLVDESPALTAVLQAQPRLVRSEEHTSELQSPMYLVCRLLLEKKKKKKKTRLQTY